MATVFSKMVCDEMRGLHPFGAESQKQEAKV
jgi:hypothetical protein